MFPWESFRESFILCVRINIKSSPQTELYSEGLHQESLLMHNLCTEEFNLYFQSSRLCSEVSNNSHSYIHSTYVVYVYTPLNINQIMISPIKTALLLSVKQKFYSVKTTTLLRQKESSEKPLHLFFAEYNFTFSLNTCRKHIYIKYIYINLV